MSASSEPVDANTTDEDVTPKPPPQDLPSVQIELLLVENLGDVPPVSTGKPPPDQQHVLDEPMLPENMEFLMESNTTRLEGNGMACGAIPLMEYSHSDLITDEIRVSPKHRLSFYALTALLRGTLTSSVEISNIAG
jgi:hypothetical protein